MSGGAARPALLMARVLRRVVLPQVAFSIPVNVLILRSCRWA